MNMLCAFEHQAFDRALALDQQTVQDRLATMRQEGEQLGDMLLVQGSIDQVHTRCGTFSHLKGCTRRGRNARLNRYFTSTQGKQALQHHQHNLGNFVAREWAQVEGAVSREVTRQQQAGERLTEGEFNEGQGSIARRQAIKRRSLLFKEA